MKYTNKHNLSDIIRLWLEFDEYDYHPGIYSATRLLKPTRMVVLEKRHENELEMDITDVIASRYGTALHESFEKVPIPNCIQEIRFFAELDGHRLSGKPDILEIDNGIFNLWDIKSTSVWTHIFGSRDEDYRIQLSVYRWLVMHGIPEDGMELPKLVDRNGKIIYLFTDWAKSRAKQGGDYPPLRVMEKDVKMMTTEETEMYIRGRLGAIHHYLDNPKEPLPRCTNEELWMRPMVMKEGRKSPVKKFQTEDEANEFLSEMDDKHYIEWSPANRCGYCLVPKWCEQFKELEKAGLIAEG